MPDVSPLPYACSAAGLVWDPNIAASAQAYANNCVFAHSGTSLGENLSESRRLLWHAGVLGCNVLERVSAQTSTARADLHQRPSCLPIPGAVWGAIGSCSDAVSGWAAEAAYWVEGSNDFIFPAGHFTQVSRAGAGQWCSFVQAWQAAVASSTQLRLGKEQACGIRLAMTNKLTPNSRHVSPARSLSGRAQRRWAAAWLSAPGATWSCASTMRLVSKGPRCWWQGRVPVARWLLPAFHSHQAWQQQQRATVVAFAPNCSLLPPAAHPLPPSRQHPGPVCGQRVTPPSLILRRPVIGRQDSQPGTDGSIHILRFNHATKVAEPARQLAGQRKIHADSYILSSRACRSALQRRRASAFPRPFFMS